MSFSDAQIKKLSAKLSDKHVRTRIQDGKTLSYIEGWHVIAEANRIFGYDCWNRETVELRSVWEGRHETKVSCCYMAHVCITVTSGETCTIREGTGFGSGTGSRPADAHELAMKAAETDAMKRALATFGNQFGLALYDKKQVGVRHTKARKSQEWPVFDQDGVLLSMENTPVQFCSDIRRTMENINDYPAHMAFWNENQKSVAELRRIHPKLETDDGRHYGELLINLYTRRLSVFAAEHKAGNGTLKPNQESHGSVIEVNHPEGASLLEKGSTTDDPNTLSKGPPRLRDKSHLKFVASQACLVCGRTPSQAHHLKHAQVRALGRKPGDQWTVPLCAIHHRKLHDHGNEAIWWPSNNIDPLKVAEGLWQLKP